MRNLWIFLAFILGLGILIVAYTEKPRRAPACYSDLDCEFKDECIYTDVKNEKKICLNEYDRQESERRLLQGEMTLEKAKQLEALSRSKIKRVSEEK